MPLKTIFSLGLLEVSLLQIICYSILWLIDEYVATLISTIIVPIILSVVVISFISDKIEPSKVGRNYYFIMIISAIVPLLVAAFFLWAYEGILDFMQ